jgi:hypothetical protein
MRKIATRRWAARVALLAALAGCENGAADVASSSQAGGVGGQSGGAASGGGSGGAAIGAGGSLDDADADTGAAGRILDATLDVGFDTVLDDRVDAAPPSFSACALTFPYQDEPGLGSWLGGDSAYSTMLTPNTALWSFQDTFVGKVGQKVRQGAALIANSLALVACDAGVPSIHYVWGSSASGPRAIFDDATPNERFWPQQPFLYQGTLFAAMTRVQGGATEVGTSLARVANPMDPPAQWKVESFDLAPLSGLGKGAIVVDEYVYLFGAVGDALVTRLPLAELVKPNMVPSALLQYLSNDGTWKAGLVTGDSKRLGFAANVGTSFRYLKASSRWLVLFTNTSGWPSADISVSTAPSLEGPWSQPTNVYRVPEMTPGAPEYDVDNVCYAAIEHVESNPDPEASLLFSYTCNSVVFAKQLANMGIYLPKIVKMKNPVSN